jgi:potassium-dependent mechanosensitive channel
MKPAILRLFSAITLRPSGWILRLFTVFFICLAGSTDILSQGILSPVDPQQGRQSGEEQRADRDAAEKRDSARARIVPIPGIRITEAFNETFDMVNSAGKKRLTDAEIKSISGRIDELFSDINLFLSDSLLQNFEGVSIRELDNIDDRARYYLELLDEMQSQISEQARQVSETYEQLNESRSRWRLTLDSLRSEQITVQRRERIRQILNQIDSVRSILQEDLVIILDQQDRISDRRFALETLQDRVESEEEELLKNLFSADVPGFFGELSHLGDDGLIGKHTEQLRKSVATDWQLFKANYSGAVLVLGFLFIVLLILAFGFRRNFPLMTDVEKFDFSAMHRTIIHSPVISIVFLSALLVRFILPGLPPTFAGFNLVILMVSLLIIVIRLFGSLFRNWMIVLVVVYSLTFVYELIYSPDILLRIILMGFSTAGLLLFIWIIRRKPLASMFSSKSLYAGYRLILFGFTLMLLVAIIGNLAGALRMAEFFTLLPIQVAVLAIGIQVTIRVVDTIIFLVLASNRLQKLNVIRDEMKVIHRKIVWLATLLLWVFFIVQVFGLFRIRQAFFDWGERVLTTGRKIGEVNISPGSILVFIFVIWLSIFITRILRYILEKDVFERMTVSRGMPGTIILLMRIALITGGFFLAAAAAGMELTNLSIIVGALSVGIGFGLQNIFNNMVSGLILAFERPIKVGDTVQVGDLMGVVLSIGLRSSTVRSFDGAEVIVPNGNLISDQMINWTKSDSNRRMDIRVGVAYGTDPEHVLAILLKAAEEHENVQKQPVPKGFFLGFGDSSLDFRLLAWVDLEFRLETESQLYTDIYRRLGDAGIEIPFPQRDLHLRSDFREK